MKWYRLFPAIKPRHSFESVVQELIEGLRDGSIVLDKPLPCPGPAPCSDNGSYHNAGPDHPHESALEIPERIER